MEKVGGNPRQRAGVMVSGRHGKPIVTVVPRGAACSVSAGDAYICMFP